MADASKLHPFILQWEGGFVNDPLDRGGATNKGITIATYEYFCSINGRSKPTVDDLKSITNSEWIEIFQSLYWDAFRADEIRNQSIANICVDWAWASGSRTAIKKVQKILGVSSDGIVGKNTLNAINSADQRELFDKIHAARIAFVDDIVRRRPSQARFIRGWKRRINAIKFTT